VPKMLRKLPVYKGIEIRQEIPDISLIDMNNFLVENPIYSGLIMDSDNKVYGILMQVEAV